MTVHQRNSDWSTVDVVADAITTGSFAPGGSTSYVTDRSGSCTLSNATIRNTNTAKAAVTGISETGMTYDASQNTVTEVVVTRP